MSMHSTNYILCFLLLSLLCLSCSKEPLSLKDVPFEELESSFYEINSNTIEFSVNEVNNAISFQGENNMLLSKDMEKINDLEIGDILVSDFSMSGPEFFSLEVTEINDLGSQLSVKTKFAPMVKAYKEYYFDSERPEIIGLRNSFNLSSAFPASVLDFFVGLLNENIESGQIDLNLELSGMVQGTLAHPHTAYRIFGPCNGSQACFDGLDQTDSDKDGIIDVVEIFYGINSTIENIGFYTIKIEDFKIEELDFEVKVGSDNLDQLNYNIQESPDFILGDVKNRPKGIVGAERPFNIYYIPAFSIGAVGFFVPVAPVLEIDFDASSYVSVENEFPNSVDLNIGHLDWRNTIPSIAETFQASQNGKTVDIDKIFEGFTSSIVFGAEGKIEKKIGLAVGAAVSTGEPNKAGVSIGGLVSMGMFNSFEGSIALTIPNVQSFAIDETTVSGSVCFDMGLTWDTHLFVDDNLAENILGDIFDLQYTIPKENLGFEDISFFDYVDLPNDADDVCFSFNQCINSSLAYLHLGADEDDNAVVELRVDNNNITSQTYNLSINYVDATGADKSTSIEGLSFGEEIRETITDVAWVNLFASFVEGDLEVIISIPTTECEEKISPAASSFSFNCDNPFISEISTNEFEFITRKDVAGNDVIYMKFEDAQSLVGSLDNMRIPTIGELELLLSELECNNPTGLYLPPGIQGNDVRYINGHESYFWVSDQVDQSGSVSIAKVDYLNTIGGVAFKSIKLDFTHPLSSFVALIPVDL